MYMVCTLHTLGQGGILEATSKYSSQYYLAWLLEIAAYCAVNCFALISGYVGVTARFRPINLLRLWLQAAFYTISITLIFRFAAPETVSLKTLLKAFIPFCTNTYWYLTAYALLFLTLPLLNSLLLQSHLRDTLRSILLILAIPASLLAILPGRNTIAAPFCGGYSAIWLAYLYLIGGFIHLNGIDALLHLPHPGAHRINALIHALFASRTACALTYVAVILLTYLAWMALPLLEQRLIGHPSHIISFVAYNSPTILIASIALLQLFTQLQLPSSLNAVIRFASPLAFSVYLIQNQPLIWKHLFHQAFSGFAALSPLPFLLVCVATPLAIYLVCSAIDFLRLQLFKFLRLP